MSQHHHRGDNLQECKVVLALVPFPAQGHLNQLLHLARLLSSYNIPIHFLGTNTHVKQSKIRVHGWEPHSNPNIHFHEFQTPHFSCPPPNPNSTTKFPSHLQPSFNAATLLRHPTTSLLRQISATANRLIVIHDSLMGTVVQDIVRIPNAECYAFHSVSAFSVFLYLWERNGRPFTIEDDIIKEIPSLEGCFTSEFVKFINSQFDLSKFSSGRILNTSKAIEGPYIDFLAKDELSEKKKQWAIGPFNPIVINRHHNQNQNQKNKSYNISLKWLDEQAPNSVIFVSFGTTTSFTDEQINQIAIGLEQSGQRFIWVLRDADKGDVFDGNVRRANLPKGYEERIEGQGIVVRDWAPQLEILAHFATGGFISHCGWNSCIESITCGVPILAWPIHSDQPRNTVLLTNFLKIGFVVRDWNRAGEIVAAEAVERGVRRLMASEEGSEVRRRAAELGGAVRISVAEGGSSRVELDSFIAHIIR
nr:glycosyltransferase [Lonicera macranthoides]